MIRIRCFLQNFCQQNVHFVAVISSVKFLHVSIHIVFPRRVTQDHQDPEDLQDPQDHR